MKMFWLRQEAACNYGMAVQRLITDWCLLASRGRPRFPVR
jgi:hypothetical protein